MPAISWAYGRPYFTSNFRIFDIIQKSTIWHQIMIELNIPGRGTVTLKHLIFDVNGTLAVDGLLLDGLPRRINALQDRFEIHLLTADTHGHQHIIDQQLNLKAVCITPGMEAEQKARFVLELGAENVIAIGQGANDAGMLKNAGIGICLVSLEGTAIETLLAADLLVPDIYTALDLLDNPLRIVATLRK
jgi:P-type E1-E2 ATPase